jgi:RNA polymerase sigma-70 factor (ECF subfamily)
MDEIRLVMDGLTELQRRTFALHDLEGWDHQEIASELGTTPGSSRVHLHAARKAMREHLSAYPAAWSRS